MDNGKQAGLGPGVAQGSPGSGGQKSDGQMNSSVKFGGRIR